MNKIPYGKQHIDKEDIKYVSYALQKDLITTGDSVKKYEKKIIDFLKCKFVIACNSGTAGLHLAFASLGISKNDIIIMPAINFVASLNVASNLGAKVFLADVDKISGQMTPQTVLDCIKVNKIKNVKLLITMYLGGHPLSVVEFFKLKKKLKCFLIEDACHALGSHYLLQKKKYMIGSCKHSDISVFSTHPIKSITTGEGGFIATNNKFFYKKMLTMRSHGIVKSKINNKKFGSWYYDVVTSGFNYRISDINCALGISQLKKINLFLKKRNSILNFYVSKIHNFKKIISIFTGTDSKNFSSNHLVIANINFTKLSINKKKLFEYLKKANIFPQVNYVPLYKFTIYKHLDVHGFKGAEEYYKNSISLPIYYTIKKSDIRKVCDNLKIIINKFSYE